MSTSIIENNNNFNGDLNINSNQIEEKENDFFSFNDEHVAKPTPNFELKLKMYLKEPASI